MIGVKVDLMSAFTLVRRRDDGAEVGLLSATA